MLKNKVYVGNIGFFNITIYILIIMLSIFDSTKLQKVNLCINCKHFKKIFFTPNIFAKCGLYPIKDTNVDYLVDGYIKYYNEYNFCSTARKFDFLCGLEGKFYEEK